MDFGEYLSDVFQALLDSADSFFSASFYLADDMLLFVFDLYTDAFNMILDFVGGPAVVNTWAFPW